MDIIQNIDKQINELIKRQNEINSFLSKIGAKPLSNNKNIYDSKTEFSIPSEVKKLSQLRIAAIMDEFSYGCYSPECMFIELTINGWKKEIDSFKPHLIFIESAWKGKNNSWYRKIANGSDEYYEMTSYCKNLNIPIVFWNKEDPVYTNVFMPAASMADFVFTTDIDCIKIYKQVLGHDRVYHLHFAAQPKMHNPIEKYIRKDKFCFAGAYYHRYKERSEVFDSFADLFINWKGLDIFDRNYGNALPEHAFPEKYNPFILGKLEGHEIEKAYKGYNYGVNMNSINQSQTMFARRVFELLASNTVVVGNYSRGQKNYFGDLTICTDDSKTLFNMMSKYMCDIENMKKYKLLGLRKVLLNNLYEDRLDYICKKVFGKSLKKELPKVTIISFVNSENEYKRITNMFVNQTYKNKELIIFTDLKKKSKDKIRIYEKSKSSNLVSFYVKNGFLSFFDEKNWYGDNYIIDMMLTLRYGDYKVIGKASFFKKVGKKVFIENNGHNYCAECDIPSCRSVANIKLLINKTFDDYKKMKFTKKEKTFSIDEFNYCENNKNKDCLEAKDLEIADKGIDLDQIEEISEKIKHSNDNGKKIIIEKNKLFSLNNNDSHIMVSKRDDGIEIKSNLIDTEHINLFFEEFLSKVDVSLCDKVTIFIKGEGGLNVLGVLVFYDENFKKISSNSLIHTNRKEQIIVPNNTFYIKLGLRIMGNGSFIVKSINICDFINDNDVFLGRSNVLVLTNNYPSYNELYKNAFVHKRVKEYSECGRIVDVMRMNAYSNKKYREYDGINIVEGGADELDEILHSNKVDTICVHFLDKTMWETIKPYINKIRLLIWCHGSDIQPWWRRNYNYETKIEIENAKIASNIRQKFWKDVFDKAMKNDNIHFTFVSNYFAEEVKKDNNINLLPNQYSVIHNFIDTNLFDYIKKDSSQRKCVLSIKSYSSKTYANDITLKAIKILSKDKCFNDMTFDLFGSGDRFKKDTKGLSKYKNVHLHNEFLTQLEISKLHKNHGVYIATTRSDTQGVSRDEAMSSGLVPIATNVTAIPEFVNDECGILVPNDDAAAVADALKELYYNPDKFLKLSENAANRVRNQSSKNYTISKEIGLIWENKNNAI